MKTAKIKNIIGLAILLAVVILGHGVISFAMAADDAPELPAMCSQIQVPNGYRVVRTMHALGVQIYRWNGSTWDFVAPDATLYANEDFRGKLGTHYVGPTWETNSGSFVVGRRFDGCDPDPSAISWLRLDTVTSGGHGAFNNVTHIQRLNTRGGLKPVMPGTVIGEVVRMPYSADYYFYKERHGRE